jgi:hypothetical protein
MSTELKSHSLSFIAMESGLKLDEDKGILYGAQVAKLGEAEGHGFFLDETTLDQVVALGNAQPKGVKVRFGHPNECTPALGTVVGVRKNFSRDGDYVRSDLHITDVANPEYKRHIFAMAKLHPEKIGNSMVFDGVTELRRDEKGEPLRDERGQKLPPVVRVKRLRAVDVVDEPAAGDGMFAAPVDGVTLSPRTILEIRNAAEQPGFLERVKSFLLGREGLPTAELEADADDEVSETEEDTMSALTLKDFKEQHPGVAKEYAGELSAQHAEALALARQEGAKEERTRITRFLEKCEPYNFEPEKDMPRGFGFHAVQNGLSFEDSLEGLFERKGKHQQLSALESASGEVGGKSAPVIEGELSAAQAADQALIEFAIEFAKKNGGE